MNSLLKEEKQIIYKIKSQDDPTDDDIQKLINIKKRILKYFQTKDSSTKYDILVRNKAIDKSELIKKYNYFSNLYEYIKLQNLQDSEKILEILNVIESELLSI